MKRSEILGAIRNAIKDKLEWVVFTDLDKGQLKHATADYPMPMPAILVQMKAVPMRSASQGSQIGKMIVTISLYQELVTDTFTGCESETESDSLLDRADDVWKSLDLVHSGKWGNLVRLTELEPVFGQRYIGLRTEYQVSIKDIMPARTTTTSPSPVVKIATETYA